MGGITRAWDRLARLDRPAYGPKAHVLFFANLNSRFTRITHQGLHLWITGFPDVMSCEAACSKEHDAAHGHIHFRPHTAAWEFKYWWDNHQITLEP